MASPLPSACARRRRRALAWALLGALPLAVAPAALAGPGHLDRSHELARDLAAPSAQGMGLGPGALAPGGKLGALAAGGIRSAPRWCGKRRTTDDTAHAVFRRRRTIKLVYAHPRGRPNRFRRFARLLQANVGVMTRFVAEQSGYRKTLRFDMGTSCGSRYVDIQFLRLKRRAPSYMVKEDGYWVPTIDPGTRLHRELRRATKRQRRKVHLAYFDGLNLLGRGEPQWAWGMADVLEEDNRPGRVNRNNRGGRIAAVFGPDRGRAPLRQGGFESRMFMHELFHILGAVQRKAPHSTAGGHCFDGSDVMCYRDGSRAGRRYTDKHCSPTSKEIFEALDCRGDDYFNPTPQPGSYLSRHWNTYDSFFLGSCRDPRLRAACAEPSREPSFGPLPSGPPGESVILSNDVSLSSNSAKVGKASMRLTVREGDALAELASGPLTLPAGRYRLLSCLESRQGGEVTWSYCWKTTADSSSYQPLPASTTVPRQYGEPIRVLGWVSAERIEGDRQPETAATSFRGSDASGLDVPAR